MGNYKVAITLFILVVGFIFFSGLINSTSETDEYGNYIITNETYETPSMDGFDLLKNAEITTGNDTIDGIIAVILGGVVAFTLLYYLRNGD